MVCTMRISMSVLKSRFGVRRCANRKAQPSAMNPNAMMKRGCTNGRRRPTITMKAMSTSAPGPRISPASVAV